jgi:RimJ/RimL family protein N-acetyltransferase
MTTADAHGRPARPELAGSRVRLRPGDQRDAPALRAILAEPEVACWWGEPQPATVVEGKLAGDDESVAATAAAPVTPGVPVTGTRDREERKTAWSFNLDGFNGPE